MSRKRNTVTVEQKQFAIDKCITQMKYDLIMEDETAIDELLKYVPFKNLVGFLSKEEDQQECLNYHD